jgi:hypothetical protein
MASTLSFRGQQIVTSTEKSRNRFARPTAVQPPAVSRPALTTLAMGRRALARRAKPLAVAVSLAMAFLASRAEAATYYVAPTGSDTNAGSMTAPFASWARAEMAAAPGDTVYFRGGTYKYTRALSTCPTATSTINVIDLTKSGKSGNPIRYWAYSGEKPVFDFSGVTDTTKYSCRQVGVHVEADWLHLKGLEFTGTLQLNNQNHESWCVYITNGSNNTFELLDVHHNMGPGFFLTHGSNNLFLNCDSHENEDALTSNGDGQSADGFGCHPEQAGDTGNVFRGCRAWWNTDDAWDFINARAACTVEYSWAWYQGYKPDALSNGQPVILVNGNGNGFKVGGYGDPQGSVPTPTPQHVARFNASFFNKTNGLDANLEIVSPFFYNNTSFNNGPGNPNNGGPSDAVNGAGADVNMHGLNGTTPTSVGTLRNNIAYQNTGLPLLLNMMLGGPISDSFNSWDANMNLTVTDADFQSVAFAPPASCPAPYTPGGTPCCKPNDMTCFAGMASARQADGSLPVLPFLRLAANSPLIGKGTNVGLPFTGKAPDLGCFDSGSGTVNGGAPGSASGGNGASGSNGVSGGTAASGGVVGASGGGGGTSGIPGSSSGNGSSAGSGLSANGGPSDTGGGSGAGTSTGMSGNGAMGGPSGSSGDAASSGASTPGTKGGGSNGAGSGGCSFSAGARCPPAGAWIALGFMGLAARRRSRRNRAESRPYPAAR